MKARSIVVALPLAAALVASSCGSGSSSDGSPTSESTLDVTATDARSDDTTASTSTSTSPSTSTSTTTDVEPSTDPTSTTSTTPSTTTTAPSTSTSTSTPTSTSPSPSSEGPAIDIAAVSLVGVAFDGAPPGDVVAAELETALGAPDHDTGWLAMPPKLVCTGNLDYRNVQWGDFRIVLERSSDGGVSPFFGWSVGLAAISLVPGDLMDWSQSSDITTTAGIGLGDPAGDLLASDFDNLRRADPTTLQAIGPRVITIETDADDEIVGFASGRTDCIGGDIASIPCDRPVPVYSLPDGTPTQRPSIDDDSAFWAVEQIDDPQVDNTITESLETDETSFFELAATAPIRASSGETTVVAIPIGDPGVGGWAFVVVDDRIECDRLLRTPFPFEEDPARRYAETLAMGFNPQL